MISLCIDTILWYHSLTDIKEEDVLKNSGFRKWITILKEFIEGELKVTATTTGRSVQFEFRNEGLKLSVDLLVSPYWSSPEDFYHFLRRIPKEKCSMYVT